MKKSTELYLKQKKENLRIAFELSQQVTLDQKSTILKSILEDFLLLDEPIIEISAIKQYFDDIDKLEKTYQKAAKEYLEKKTEKISEMYEEIKGF